MNQGERDELIIQLKLVELRDSSSYIRGIGSINSVAFNNEYKSIPKGILVDKLYRYTDSELERLAKSCGITKSGAGYKADTRINGEAISLKSTNMAPPALVNHTTRPGFEVAATYCGGKIELLDELINNYWQLRISKRIGEDICNDNAISPFKNNKAILKPFLNYFLFIGTGKGPSSLPAKRILSFHDPVNTQTWRFYDFENATDLYWDKLIFSLRSKKGMPNGYPNSLSPRMKFLKPSIDKWTRLIDGDYRGALHIRSKT